MPIERPALPGLIKSKLAPNGRLTKKELAEELGIVPKTVQQWLDGRSAPGDRLRWELCVLLNMTMDELAKACAGLEGGS